jgi:glucan biosynthesis protein C
MNTQSTNVQRRYELDWLRVLAILAVFFYHCALIFGPDASAIKSPTTYRFVDDVSDFFGSWGMPLILLISGASAFYALGKVGAGTYLKGITARLLIPLIVGIFTHCALQVYLEKLHKGTFSGSFLDFYPHYFDGMYAFGGNFAWMGLHLWYLEALFVFSLIFLPLFLWFRNGSGGQRALRGLGDLLAKPGGVYLFALPAIILINLLDPETWGTTALGGWSLFIYPCFFVSGFVMISHEQLQESIKRWRWISLVAGILLSLTVDPLWIALGDPDFGTWGFALGSGVYCLSAWCCLLAVFGLGFQHLTISKPFLRYANEAALPFYILHYTVIVGLGYFVVQWAIPDWLKFAFILTASFLATISLYEFGVRRHNVLRFLFGMKLAAKSPAVQPQEPQVIEGARTS